MIALINELTDKEGWERFVFDNDATFKWKEETLMSGRDITRAMVDWVRNVVLHSLTPRLDRLTIYAVLTKCFSR